MIADLDHVQVLHELPAPPRLAPDEIRHTTTLTVERMPTARQSGLRTDVGVPDDSRYCDTIPELMIELI